MDNALRFLTEAALSCMREGLSSDPDYLQYQAEEKALWDQLRRRYPPEVRRALMAVVDAQCGLLDIETERAFLTGLQLGISMGRLDLMETK